MQKLLNGRRRGLDFTEATHLPLSAALREATACLVLDVSKPT
jgi:hypothetical protein